MNHLVGIMENGNPQDFGIEEVHVWLPAELSFKLPQKPWLHLHTPIELSKSLGRQVAWQLRSFHHEIRVAKCGILLKTDAGSVAKFRPSVTMSRDMLSFEDGEMRRYGFSLARLRLELLKHVQAASLRRSDGSVFLTTYARDVIQKFTGRLENVAVIPHGIGADYKNYVHNRPFLSKGPIECVYVSNEAPYKHQWNVVKAIENLRKLGIPVRLTLIGIEPDPTSRTSIQIRESDPNGVFVSQLAKLSAKEIIAEFKSKDIFVFASSCENMPNTLLEGMACGLPIACSSRGPMPSILQDAGVYFDPENVESIGIAIQSLIDNPNLRDQVSKTSLEYSRQFSWSRCAAETFGFVSSIANMKFSNRRTNSSGPSQK